MTKSLYHIIMELCEQNVLTIQFKGRVHFASSYHYRRGACGADGGLCAAEADGHPSDCP